MRNDYHVLSHGPADGPWEVEELRARYAEGGYNGVNLRFMHPAVFKDLDFLLDLADLRYVEINGRISNDTAVFRLPAVRELVLLTRSRRRIPGFAGTGITRLGIDDRPGKEHIAELGRLQSLMIWLWKGEDLAFLSHSTELRGLRLEGTKQLARLDGIEACVNLTELEVWDARIASLAPLADLTELRSLRLLSGLRSKGAAVLDLSDLSALTNLEELSFNHAGSVRSLTPLLELPALRDVRLSGTEIADGDLSPLDRLALDTAIVRPD